MNHFQSHVHFDEKIVYILYCWLIIIDLKQKQKNKQQHCNLVTNKAKKRMTQSFMHSSSIFQGNKV